MNKRKLKKIQREQRLKMNELAEKLVISTQNYCRSKGYSPVIAAIALFAAALHIISDEIMESDYIKELEPDPSFDDMVGTYMDESETGRPVQGVAMLVLHAPGSRIDSCRKLAHGRGSRSARLWT